VYHDAQGVAHTYGTINLNAVTASGDIASVTTTSGLSWKIPGRVGDSPLIGCGCYADAQSGGVSCTGYGEAIMRAAVAEMQRRTGLERIVLQSTEAGYALYRRMGFRDATRFSVYLTK